MTVILRDFVSNNEHFRMPFQQMWYSAWSESNWLTSRFCSPMRNHTIFKFWWKRIYILDKMSFSCQNIKLWWQQFHHTNKTSIYDTFGHNFHPPKFSHISDICYSAWGSRIRSLFNFKYLTENDYFDHPNCLWWIIIHHVIILHRFRNIDILLGRFGGEEQILFPHEFPTTKKPM